MGLFSKKKTSVPFSSALAAPPPASNVDYSTMAAPKKYLKINGVMKLNPEYKKWTESKNRRLYSSIKMRPLVGATRLSFLGFFASHIIFTLIIDSQAIVPLEWIPVVLQDLLAFEVATFNDPLMGNARELLWFQSLVACELFFQLPYFFAAVFFFRGETARAYPDWFRSACIVYGAHTATTMAPILTTLATNEAASLQERALVTAMYLPYLIFPLWILWIAVTDDSTPPLKNKSS
jgi:hypothetical protein